MGKHDEKVAVMLSLGLVPQVPFPGQRVGWDSLCRRCGSEVAPHFSTIRNALKNGIDRSCRECGAKKGQLTRRKADYQKLLERLPSFGFQLTGNYENAKTTTEFECLDCGLETSTTSDSITQGRKKCPCKRLPRRPLAEFAPEIAEELANDMNGTLDATRIGTGMRTNVWWQCPEEKHFYDASPANRVRGSGCRYCLGMEAYPGTTDLLSTHPELCEELAENQPDGITATNLTSGSSRLVNWKCKTNPLHIYPCSPYERTRKASGCSYCAGKRVLVGDNDLHSRFPEVAAEWDYEENYPQIPENFTPGSNKRFGWICSWNPSHRWRAPIASRTKGHGCQQCAWVKKGVNDLATKASEDPSRRHLLEEWDEERNECSPEDVSFSDNDQYWWRCPRNLHPSYPAKLSNRWFSLTSCPTCSPSAYSTAKPGRFYFLHNESLGAMKIGITNISAKTDRVKRFNAHGWSPHLTIEHESGLLVKMLEKRMLYMIRVDWKLPPGVAVEDMLGMGGATETFANPPFSVSQIAELINSEFQLLKSSLEESVTHVG